MNLELQSHETEALRARTDANTTAIARLTGLIELDAENLRSLARVAEAHEHRL
jgi:hypothetical protein